MENTTQPVKFDETELKELGEIRSGYADAAMMYGNLYLQRKQLLTNEENLDTSYKALQKREREFLDVIVAKYGEGNLDSTTGIFTPAPKKS